MKTLLATIMFATTTLFGADLVLQWQDNSDNEDGFEIWRQQNGGEWLLIAATNADDKTFPTSGTNYAENTSAVFNSNFSGTRYIAFGARAQTKNSWYDDLEVTGEE